MQKYKLMDRQVTRLQENASHCAAKVVAFCERMGFAGLKAVLSLFQVRRMLCCAHCRRSGCSKAVPDIYCSLPDCL